MEKHGLVLNLHGEVLESLAPANTTLEEAFLPTLKTLHERFPQLRIVLEHCTTAAAVEAVRACGPTVGCMSLLFSSLEFEMSSANLN